MGNAVRSKCFSVASQNHGSSSRRVRAKQITEEAQHGCASNECTWPEALGGGGRG